MRVSWRINSTSMKISVTTVAPLALLIFAGCGSKTNAPAPTAPETTTNTTISEQTAATPATNNTPMPKMTPINAPGAQRDTKKYRVRGLVTGVEKSEADGRMTLIVKHENIPDFMPAMEMRLPFGDNNDATKIKAGDKIVFDLQRSNLEVSNFETLPASTQLKLKK